MTREEFFEAIRGCNEFLLDHPTRSVRERLLEAAESPFADLRPDGYGKGGILEPLETEIAELLGKEAAVFMPSGTMAQQIALRIWADRANSKSVAFHPLCHLEIHEHMGYRELHGLEATLLGSPDRVFTLEDLAAVDPPPNSLLIEFPQREIGGQLPTWEEFQAIAMYARSKGIRMHLDGARLWECQPYFGRPYRDIVADFDSVYVSFYKILGGLAGAALAGPSDFIAEARIWQRRHGGNLVNLYPNAIAAKIGLDRHLPRIPAYVAKAQEVAEILNGLPGVTVVPNHPPTNMMHSYFDVPADALRDAGGQIALREKTALFFFAKQTERGSRVELWFGEAGLKIPRERIRSLFEQLMELLAKGR